MKMDFILYQKHLKIHYYSAELYKKLEEETGQATGWHGCGAIRLAVDQDQVDWFHYVKGVLDQVGAECHLLGPDQIKEVHNQIRNFIQIKYYTIAFS